MSQRDLSPGARASGMKSTSGRALSMFFSLLASLCALCLMFVVVVVRHPNHLSPISFQLPASDRTPGETRPQRFVVGKTVNELASENNGWLLFASDSAPTSSSNGANKSGRGHKWAAAVLLDDFATGISPFEPDEAASVHESSNETTKQHDNRYSSRTQRDLREMRRRRDTPTFGVAAANQIELTNKSLETLTPLNSGDGKNRRQELSANVQKEKKEKKLEEHFGVKNVASTMRVRRKRRAGNERGKPILNEFSFPANLVQGMRFVLMCQVLDGEPPIQIKWFKDNSDLLASISANQDNRPQGAPISSSASSQLDAIEMISNDELGSSLLFRRVKQQHGGNYTCLASNHLGSASYSSLMTVKVPPNWHVEPQDQESIMGEQIRIDCQATGNPNPFIRWKFASGIQFDKISPSLGSQADLLQGQGQAQGHLHPTGDRQQHSAINNNQFKLINSNHHVQTLENGSLIIRQAAKEHEGLYLCEADNGVEPSLVKQMKLIVHKQVHFVDDIQVVLQQQLSGTLTANAKGSIISKDHVSASSTAIQSNQLTAQSIKSVRIPQNSSLVRLVCSPLGDAPIQLEWLKDGRLIHTHSSGPAPTSNNNEIALVQDSTPHETTSSQQTNEHSSTIGRYHVSTRWSNVVVTGSRTPVGLESELLLTNLNRHDAGLYTCAARNAFGQSERKLRLTVQEPPESPTLVDVAHISSRAIALRWSAPFDGNSPILKYVVEYRRQVSQDLAAGQQQQSDIPGSGGGGLPWLGRSEKLMPISSLRPSSGVQADPNAIVVSQLLASGANGGPQVQHTVHDLEPLTRYSMQVIAVNALGQSAPSVALSLRTEEEVPATVPNLVEAAVLSSRSIKLRWTISYALEHELIDGFFIGYRSFDAPASALLLDSSQPPSGQAQPPSPLLDSPVDASGNPISGASSSSPSAAAAAAAAANNPKQFTYKTIRLTNQHLQPPGSSHGESASSRTAPILSPIASVTKLMPVGAAAKSAVGNVKEAPPAPQELAYVMSTFEHVIGGLERNTEYTFLIQCFNKKGAGPTSDPVMAKTLLSDPPEKLMLMAEDLSETSLRVSWHFPGEPSLLARAGVDSTLGRPPADPVDGFLLTFARMAPRSALAARKSNGAQSLGSSFQHQPDSPAARIVQQPTGSGNNKQVFGGADAPAPAQASVQLLDGQWQAIQLAPQQRTHVLKQLECGSWYALKISAFNRVGKGELSDLVTAATRGKAPLAPTRSHFLAINSTQVRLHLGAWHDGGCAIEKFIVQYRARSSSSSSLGTQLAARAEPWILVSNNIVRDQQSVLIRDLAPATTYELLVGAQNHVGLSEAKYRFGTLDSEGKQVVGAFADDSSDDSNSFVDYSDDSGVRRESYGSGPEGSMFLPPNGGIGATPNRWLLAVRQVLNSPLTLLLTFCVFLVLLGLLLFHRFSSQTAGQHHHHHHQHHQNHEGNYHSGTGNSSAKLDSAPGAPNHLVGRCSIDGLATIIDGEPPLSSSSAATDSPARVNITENNGLCGGGGGGGSRLANGGYAPLDCYGGGTYCSGPVAPPGGDQQQYGAHQPEYFAAPDNYTASMGQQQQQQQQIDRQIGYYSQQGSSIYGTTAGSHDQQCLMQMLLMSPGQQQVDSCASASALATMARQKAGVTMKPMSGAYGNQNHLTLGRQLLDMQRAQAAAAAQHIDRNQQADSYQMSTFQRQQQDLISIYREGAGATTNMSSSLASTSGCGTSATASTSLSGQATDGCQHAPRDPKSESCDSALDEQSCISSSGGHTTQVKECDRTFQYDVPSNANAMSHRAPS